MPIIQFAIESYKSRSLPLSAQRCLNVFVEQQPVSTKVPLALFGAPGLTQWAMVGTGPIRAMHIMDSVLYVVSAGNLYSVDAFGTATDLGSVGPATGPVMMADNGAQLVVLNNGFAYVLSTAVNAALGPPGSEQGTILAGSVTFFLEGEPAFDTSILVEYTNTVLLWQAGDTVTINLSNGQPYTTNLTTNPGAAELYFDTALVATVDKFAVTRDATQDIIVQTIIAAAAGDTRIFVTSVEGMVVGDEVHITNSNSSTHTATITALTRGVIINIAPSGLPSGTGAGTAISNTTTRLYPIEDINYYEADTVTYFDNYFVFNRKDTNEFFISEVGDGTTYPGLSFALAQVSSDNTVAVIADHEQLYVFGQRTIEVWYHNTQSTTFPFNRYDGATIERGCAAPYTVIKEDNSLFFLGNDRVFYRLQGAQPLRLSTHAIESVWEKYTTVFDAFCFSFPIDGHKFICLTFPTGISTWIYDTATKLWHERDSIDSLTIIPFHFMGRWRGNCTPQSQVYEKTLIGDINSNQIATVDMDVYTEYGIPIIGQAVSPPFRDDRKRIFISRFELEMETGVAIDSGPVFPQITISDTLPSQASTGNFVIDITADPQVPNFNTLIAEDSPAGAFQFLVESIEDIGIGDTIQIWLDDGTVHETVVTFTFSPRNPQIYLDYSKDGGYTFSKPQLPRSLGKQGEVIKRLRWLRLGQSREWYFRVTITDPVRRVIIAAYADMYTNMYPQG